MSYPEIDFTKLSTEDRQDIENRMNRMLHLMLMEHKGKEWSVVAEQLLGGVAVSLMSCDMKLEDIGRYH